MEAETTGQATYEKGVVDGLVNNGLPVATGGGLLVDKVSICKMCKEHLHGRQPKFLNCLHSLCSQCINSLDISEGQYIKCPECCVVTHLGSLIDNLFSVKPQPSLSNGMESCSEEQTKFCSGCDENVPASFFCVECSEWLCDQCTQAHKRVKITKDHTIETKEVALSRSDDTSHNSEARTIHQAFLCQVHPQEQLKLYCCTCHKMTCRDCQLLEHKDHKYQFLQEAATSYREILGSLLLKIKEKQLYIDNAKNLIEKRNSEISQKETNVINEVKAFARTLVADINHKCMQLIGDLQSICLAKKRQLLQKDAEISCLFDTLEYCLIFAEHLLTSGDDMQLLYAYHLVANRLKGILKTRCEVPNPHHVVDLRFTQNVAAAASTSKLGCIMVDGIPFNRNHSSSSGTPGQEAVNNSKNLPQMNVPGMFNNSGMQQQQQQQQPQQMNSPASMPDPKLANHWLKRQSDERRHHHVQRSQHHHLQQLQQHPMLNLLAGYNSTNSGNGIMQAADSRLFLPNQSANISSSNMSKRQSRAVSGTFYPPQQLQQQQSMQVSNNNNNSNTYLYSHAYPHLQPMHPHHSQSSQQLISLSLLQEERMRRQIKQFQQHQQQQQQHQQQQQMLLSSTRPIIIEPTNSDQLNSPNALHGFSNSLHDLSKLIQGQMSSTSDQSRSEIQAMFPAIVKQENQKNSCSNDTTTPSLLSSRSPTPRIESTTFEHSSFDPGNLFESPFDSWGPSDDVIPATNNASNNNDIRGGKMVTPPCSSNRHQNEVNVRSDINNDKNTSMSSEGSSSSCLMSPLMRASADPSEDYCAVCGNGGELLCCDGCPKVFHLHCHVSQLVTAPSDKWYCGLCSIDEVLKLVSPDEEVSNKKRHHKIDLTTKERLVCEKLLLELYCDCNSTPFHEPVSRTVPNYHKVITQPMDFRTIRIKLTKNHFGRYQCVESFIKDVLLIFSNCSTFNPESTDVGRAGKILEEKFRKRCSDLLPYIDLDNLDVECNQVDDKSHNSLKRRKMMAMNGHSDFETSSISEKFCMSAGEEDIRADGGRDTAASI